MPRKESPVLDEEPVSTKKRNPHAAESASWQRQTEQQQQQQVEPPQAQSAPPSPPQPPPQAQSAPQPTAQGTWTPPATQPPMTYQQYDPFTPPPWRPEQAQPTQAGAGVEPTAWQPPPPSGKKPTSTDSLGAPKGIGTNATHFSGPIVSGGIPQQPIWRRLGSVPPTAPVPIGGSALLTTTLVVDYSMGDFTVPVQFPAGSLLVGYALATLVAFTAAPTFKLGKTSGAADLATGALPAPGGPVTFQAALSQLPLWNAASPQIPFQAFLDISGNTGTAGLGVILLQFVRIPAKWSSPAM